MNAMLVKYLKDFSAPEPASPVVMDDFLPTGADFDFPALEDNSPPPVDLEALAEDARRDGYETATRELSARHETEIATLLSVHAGELDDLRASFEKEIAALIDQRVNAAIEELASMLSAKVGEILLPVIDEAIVRKTMDSLAVSVRDMLTREHALEIVTRGPIRLHAMLADRLAGSSIACRHVVEPGLDLSVEIDRSVVATRLAAWQEGLAEIMPQDDADPETGGVR